MYTVQLYLGSFYGTDVLPSTPVIGGEDFNHSGVKLSKSSVR